MRGLVAHLEKVLVIAKSHKIIHLQPNLVHNFGVLSIYLRVISQLKAFDANYGDK